MYPNMQARASLFLSESRVFHLTLLVAQENGAYCLRIGSQDRLHLRATPVLIKSYISWKNIGRQCLQRNTHPTGFCQPDETQAR